MARDLFSVPIFFILFRESLEAAIICSVLLGLVEQIVHGSKDGEIAAASDGTTTAFDSKSSPSPSSGDTLAQLKPDTIQTKKQLIRKLRIQIFAGAGLGLLLALAIGAAFIAVYYTQVKNLWSSAEEIWEGVFSLIAAIMIFVMAIAMLKMDRAKAKWAYKLKAAFEKHHTSVDGDKKSRRAALSEKYLLFFLPFVTVLREGLEAVVFVGGVALGEPASAIPIAAIVGLICGLGIGAVIYLSSKRINISVFLVISTSVLLLIGAGLFSKMVGFFQKYKFNKGVGGDVSETGDGPGSYDVDGNVWHLNCCNPENRNNGGWGIFNAILGWDNNASVGTILAYVFYFLAVIATLVYLKWNEGRFIMFGKESKRGRDRRARREAAAQRESALPESPATSPSAHSDPKMEL